VRACASELSTESSRRELETTRLEQQLAGEHLTGPPRQLEQEAKLRRRELQLGAAACGSEPGRVDLELAHAQYLLDGRFVPPTQERRTRATSSGISKGFVT